MQVKLLGQVGNFFWDGFKKITCSVFENFIFGMVIFFEKIMDSLSLSSLIYLINLIRGFVTLMD